MSCAIRDQRSYFTLNTAHKTQRNLGRGGNLAHFWHCGQNEQKGAKMKPKQWGLIAVISTLFLAILAIPALSNSDNSDIVAPNASQSSTSTPSASKSPTGSVDETATPVSTPSAKATSTPSSPSPDPTSDKDDDMEIPREFVKRLIGMNEEDAKVLIWDNDYISRVVHRDGEDFMVTTDFRYNRINLYINGGIVFDATVG